MGIFRDSRYFLASRYKNTGRLLEIRGISLRRGMAIWGAFLSTGHLLQRQLGDFHFLSSWYGDMGRLLPTGHLLERFLGYFYFLVAIFLASHFFRLQGWARGPNLEN